MDDLYASICCQDMSYISKERYSRYLRKGIKMFPQNMPIGASFYACELKEDNLIDRYAFLSCSVECAGAFQRSE